MPGGGAVEIITAVWGFVILLVGRQFYVSFVGGVFYVTAIFVSELFWEKPQGFQAIWIPLLFALLGWGLTLELRRWLARPAMFIAGIYVFKELPIVLEINIPENWFLYVIGGAIFFLLSFVSFDYTLMVLSTLMGATMILKAAGITPELSLGLLAVMALFSLSSQFVIMRYGQRVPD
jgi:hypothetical protein